MSLGWPRHVAPAGAPIGATDLARWLGTVISHRAPVETLTERLAARVGATYCAATCTGRAAMVVVLRALKRIRRDQRDEVIIPSYTCYSVAASVVRAGLKPRIVDISSDTLDYSWARLQGTDTTRALAIIGTNLYGMPNDMPRLAAFARAHGLVLIDDAAQALGASIAGRPCGTWGDVGIYSLDKGKNVSAIDGGLIVSSRADIIRALQAEMETVPEGGAVGESWHLVTKAAAYALLLRPWLYWIPNAIPQLGLGQTMYDTSFAVHRYGSTPAALALGMLGRLEAFTATRRANAEWLRRRLASVPGVALVSPAERSEPAYVRLPILVADPAWRGRLLAALNAAGIGATGSYPGAIPDIPHLSAYPADVATPSVGASIAQRIVTLPTHPFVTAHDLERTVDIIASVTSEARDVLPQVATA